MVQSLVTPRSIEVPAITARIGELLDIASVTEGVGWLEPQGLAETYNCLPTGLVPVWPCPPNVLLAPAISAPSTATSGGTVPAGTYRAVVTAFNARGETVASSEATQVTTGSASTVTWNWLTVAGASGYKVYVTNGAAGTENSYITVNNQATGFVVMTTYPWVGSQAGTPPKSNGAVIGAAKTFNSPAWLDGIRFAVYAGALCKGVGTDVGHIQSETERAFLANESVGVERALMTQRLVGGGSFPATVDISPGSGTLTPGEGLALLENYAAGVYAGVPTIHVARGVGSLLMTQQAIEARGSAFYSKQGSKIASGGGYGNVNLAPGGGNTPAGQSYMYATGEVAIARGDLINQQAFNQTTNELGVIVERPYVALVDCFVAACKVGVDLNPSIVLAVQNAEAPA